MLFPIDPSHSLKIRHEEDFHQAEVMLHARKMAAGKVETPRYWAPKEGIAAFAHKTRKGCQW